MNLPEIVNYLLTLRYPGSDISRDNLVCYQGSLQVRVPIIPSGTTIKYEARPVAGNFAQLAYLRLIGTDLVPETFSYTLEIGGTIPLSGLITQVGRDMEHPGWALMTERSPTKVTITNISPLAQKAEMMVFLVVIPTSKDYKTVFDALLRLETSARSETLAQEAVYLLGLMSGEPVEPLPPVGGS